MSIKTIFCDIDGTLTDKPQGMWGEPYLDRIRRLNEKAKEGWTIILWSGGGADYARAFALKYSVPALCVSKPGIVVDDCPTIRPHLDIRSPEEFFSE